MIIIAIGTRVYWFLIERISANDECVLLLGRVLDWVVNLGDGVQVFAVLDTGTRDWTSDFFQGLLSSESFLFLTRLQLHLLSLLFYFHHNIVLILLGLSLLQGLVYTIVSIFLSYPLGTLNVEFLYVHIRICASVYISANFYRWSCFDHLLEDNVLLLLRLVNLILRRDFWWWLLPLIVV